MIKQLIFAVALVAASSASAQAVLQAEAAIIQPQIGRDAEGFNACGVRAVVLVDRGKVVETYDFSLMVRAGLYFGLLKAGKYQTAKHLYLQGKHEGPAYVPAPVKFWVAKETEGVGVVTTKSTPSDTPAFTLFAADLIKTLDGVLAIAGGERMQFAVRYKAEAYDNVVSFAKGLSEQEMETLLACTRGVIQRMQARGEKQE
jgi:hypothetical protein